MTKTFLGSYRYKDANWSFEIKADSHVDAVQRLRALKASAGIDGELMAVVPGFVPVPLLMGLWRWLRGA